MPKQKKRGVMQSQTVVAIAALVLGIMLLVYNKPFISIANAQNIIEGCRLSVSLASYELQPHVWVIPLPTIDSPFQLNCQTIYTEITKDSINRADDKVQLSRDSAVRQNQLKEMIMKNMRECWYMWGEGQVKVQQGPVDTSKTACVVCSEIMPTSDFIKANPDYTLDDMYGYAAQATIPPKNEIKYYDYFLKSSLTKPDISKIPKKDIVLNKQYSIVFAITEESEREGSFFGGGHTIDAGSGIVDCYIGKQDGTTVQAKEGDAKDIGCDENGKTSGLIFGTVIDGGTDVDLLNWKNFVPLPGLGSAVTLHTYPATVRLVPSGSLSSNCASIY